MLVQLLKLAHVVMSISQRNVDANNDELPDSYLCLRVRSMRGFTVCELIRSFSGDGYPSNTVCSTSFFKALWLLDYPRLAGPMHSAVTVYLKKEEILG